MFKTVVKSNRPNTRNWFGLENKNSGRQTLTKPFCLLFTNRPNRFCSILLLVSILLFLYVLLLTISITVPQTVYLYTDPRKLVLLFRKKKTKVFHSLNSVRLTPTFGPAFSSSRPQRHLLSRNRQVLRLAVGLPLREFFG